MLVSKIPLLNSSEPPREAPSDLALQAQGSSPTSPHPPHPTLPHPTPPRSLCQSTADFTRLAKGAWRFPGRAWAASPTGQESA